MTCDEMSCRYAMLCTDLDKQKRQMNPWPCSRYCGKDAPETFARMMREGWC